jgi:hypothetical protein
MTERRTGGPTSPALAVTSIEAGKSKAGPEVLVFRDPAHPGAAGVESFARTVLQNNGYGDVALVVRDIVKPEICPTPGTIKARAESAAKVILDKIEELIGSEINPAHPIFAVRTATIAPIGGGFQVEVELDPLAIAKPEQVDRYLSHLLTEAGYPDVFVSYKVGVPMGIPTPITDKGTQSRVADAQVVLSRAVKGLQATPYLPASPAHAISKVEVVNLGAGEVLLVTLKPGRVFTEEIELFVKTILEPQGYWDVPVEYHTPDIAICPSPALPKAEALEVAAKLFERIEKIKMRVTTDMRPEDGVIAVEVSPLVGGYQLKVVYDPKVMFGSAEQLEGAIVRILDGLGQGHVPFELAEGHMYP